MLFDSTFGWKTLQCSISIIIPYITSSTRRAVSIASVGNVLKSWLSYISIYFCSFCYFLHCTGKFNDPLDDSKLFRYFITFFLIKLFALVIQSGVGNVGSIYFFISRKRGWTMWTQILKMNQNEYPSLYEIFLMKAILRHLWHNYSLVNFIAEFLYVFHINLFLKIRIKIKFGIISATVRELVLFLDLGLFYY